MNKRRILIAFSVLLVFFAARTTAETAADVTSEPRVGTAIVDGAFPVGISWVCPFGSSAPTSRFIETIVLANVGETEAQATINVFPGGDALASTQIVTIPASITEKVRVSDVAQAEFPFVRVDVTGGNVAVSHEVVSGDDMAANACTNRPTTSALFAGGSTIKGTQQWLVIANPGATDAQLDVSFIVRDDNGTVTVEEPDSLQGLSVPPRVRFDLSVSDIVRRYRTVATIVNARVGTVAVEQVMQFDGSENNRGLTIASPQQVSETELTFPSGQVGLDQRETLYVANKGRRDALVEVAILFDGEDLLEPQEISVPANSVVPFSLSETIPAGSQYAAVVRSLNKVPVFAHKMVFSGRGSALEEPIAVGSRNWIVSPINITETSIDEVVVVNSGTETARVAVQLKSKGVSELIETVKIPPGSRAVVASKQTGMVDGSLFIKSDRRVVAGVSSRPAQGLSAMSAIPWINR